jgi:hypothetical protein
MLGMPAQRCQAFARLEKTGREGEDDAVARRATIGGANAMKFGDPTIKHLFGMAVVHYAAIREGGERDET